MQNSGWIPIRTGTWGNILSLSRGDLFSLLCANSLLTGSECAKNIFPDLSLGVRESVQISSPKPPLRAIVQSGILEHHDIDEKSIMVGGSGRQTQRETD